MISSYIFGKTKSGEEVVCYRIENKNGCSAEFLNYGLMLRSLTVPDAKGQMTDVVLGYQEPVCAADGGYIGVTVGRVANRIGGAAFKIDGVSYTVTANEGANCLHGGDAFCEKVWKITPQGEDSLVAVCASPDGEDGFPGKLEATVRVSFTDENELIFSYSAVSDKKTPINFTNHAYFNLQGAGDILRHTLWIDADAITEVDKTLIPTGSSIDVTKTPFDFRAPKEIGRDIDLPNEQLKIGGGYDHNYVIKGEGFRRAAELCAPNGIRMLVSTDAPCMQVYTANFLPERQGKDRLHTTRAAVCLETQGYPNAINTPAFVPVTVEAGEVYSSKTVFAFSAK